MSSSITIGTPPIELRVRRLKQARRYSLRISSSDGSVSLTMPARASLNEALDFAQRQEGWLRKNLEKHPGRITTAFGSSILFQGEETNIRPTEGRSVRFSDRALHVPGNEDTLGAKLRGFFKVEARAQLAKRSEYHAEKIGRLPGRLTLRDTKSRWGSCSANGDLMFSWRLIMAPPEVLDYVAAHEVAHFVHMNHSPAFWALVTELKPDYAKPRSWLRKNGALLHRYDI